MSLGEDQIIKDNKYNALDELSKRINKVAVKDVSAGINEIAKFETALEKGRTGETTKGPSKSEENIDSAALANDIMQDMGR